MENNDNRFRKRHLHIMITDEEYTTICDKAISSNLSVSDAIRSLIVFGCIKSAKLDDDTKETIDRLNGLIEKSIYEINRIGNNINQIAYNTNSKYHTELNELEQAKGELISAYEVFVNLIFEMREKVNADTSYT